MSRVGRLPIEIAEGVDVALEEREEGTLVTIKGAKETLSKTFGKALAIKKEDNNIVITRSSDDKAIKALHGTCRAIIKNMLTGVKDGFTKELTWTGVGYRMAVKGKDLDIQMGYSHPILFKCPEGITFKVEGNNLKISGADKELVGQTAAEIRDIRGPEPYKGKGIRYIDEVIIRKAGKAAK